MNSLFVLSVFILLTKYSYSQDTSFLVEAGTKVNAVIPAKFLFEYPEFLDGKVFFRDETISKGKMNYNRLMDEIFFIDQHGDTLALNNETTIKFVNIGRDTFYFDHGFIMLVNNSNNFKLGVKHCFRFTGREKAAAYDLTSATSSVSSFSSFDDGKASHQLQVKEQSTISTLKQFYFGNAYNHFVFATKKNLIDAFPKYSSQLKKFCKESHIDFDKRSDLDKVINFLGITGSRLSD